MKKPSIQANVALSSLYQILTMLTPLITAPYTARVLGAECIGISSYTGSVQSYFLLFAVFGTYMYASREIARCRDDARQRSHIFWEIELLTICTTLICTAGWLVVILFGGENRLYYAIMTLNLVAVLFDISWFFAGMERFDYTVLVNSAVKILSVVCTFLFIKSPEHLPRYIAIFSLSVLLGNLSMWLFLPPYIQKPNWKEIRIWHHLPKTLVYFVPTIATSVYTVLDKTLIGVITGSDLQNGYYEQATKIINMTKSIAFVALNNVLTSRISYLYAQNNHKEIRERTDQSMGYISFMCVGITFGLISVARDFVLCFFGPEYEEVITLLHVFSPIVLIIGVSNCIASHYFTPIGLHRRVSVFLVVGAVVNLILNCILIPYMGSLGAAIASVVAEFVITILHVAFSNNTFTVGYIWHHLWKKLAAAAVMVAALLPMQGMFTSPLLTVLCQVPTGVLLYCIVLIILKDDFVLPIFRKGIDRVKEKLTAK